MGLILDTTTDTCKGHTEAEVKALAGHVGQVYGQFYQAQLGFINAHRLNKPPLTEIDDAQEERLDHLDAWLPHLSWTLPGYDLLGAGAYRVAIGLCDEHALKVNPGEVNHNDLEAQTWFSIPDNLLPVFVPVVAVAEGPDPRWLIAARAEPLAINQANDEMAQGLGRMLGLEDLHAGNLGRLHGSLVLLDYGHTMGDLESLIREFEDDPSAVELIG